jgi:predicted acetyltransferase
VEGSDNDVQIKDLRDRDLQLQFLRLDEHPFHRVPTYFFGMVHADTNDELGNINLRVSSTPHIERYAGHIGYSVYEAYRGHHYAARSVVLLAPVSKELGFASLWITCDPENAASRRTLELAGAELVETVDVPSDCIIFKSGHPRKCRYQLDLDRFHTNQSFLMYSEQRRHRHS